MLSLKTAELMADAEREFGDDFWTVVRGFCADGYSRGTTAKILGFSGACVFRRLEESLGVYLEWPAYGSCNAMKEPRGEYTKERTDKRLAAMKKKQQVETKKSKPRFIPRGKGWQAYRDV